MSVVKGLFYQFRRDRVVSRAGQPVQTRPAMEVGLVMSREEAFREVRSGRDVYTPAREDAYRLALRLAPATPAMEIHQPRIASPTGRWDVYFPHFHPGGDHERFGHIFFGERGQDPGGGRP
jgi:hypothetical protein